LEAAGAHRVSSGRGRQLGSAERRKSCARRLHATRDIGIAHYPAGNFFYAAYDLRDFTGITTTISVPNVLVVSPALGVKSVKDLVTPAKAKPGELLFSSGGVGSGTHFSAELFKSLSGIDVRHVPFRGIPEALTEVLAGRIHFTFSPLSNVLPLVGSGEIVPLAVAPATRSTALPQVPTLAEAGVSGYAWDTWFGLLAPAKPLTS
jgi:tripartite-type tricarboxylate transporter receptor subunit TctC